MLKGTGLAVFWDDVVWLVGLGVLFIAIAALRMRNKTL
jgi:hypothetical protein